MGRSILHVYKTYYPDAFGGVQQAIRQIAIATRVYGYCHSIYTLSPKPVPAILEMPEGNILRSRMKVSVASCDIGGLDSFRKHREHTSRVDVVVYHFPWPFADFLRFFSKRVKPAILVYHSDIVRQRWLEILYRPLMWWMLKSMNIIISTSPEYAISSPVLSHPSLRKKVRVIPLGIDEQMYPKDTDAGIFSRLGMDKDKPYFLFVGMLRHYKGLEFLIRAAKGMDAKVVIAGAGSQGDKLKKLAEGLGIDNIVFAGSVTDAEKVSLMEYTRALILPSHLRSEAYGMVLVEASMFGRPMISCGIGTGTSYVNQHEVTGFVVPPSSPDALAAAMKKLLLDENLSKKMGHAARQRYEALFSGPALGLAYSTLFEEVISAHDAE